MKRSISQLAADFQTSRQYIDMAIKRAMGKVYRSTSKMNPDLSPFEVVVLIAKMFNVQMAKDFERFYTDFPMSVRKTVMEDAMHRIRLINPDEKVMDIINHNSRSTKHRKKVDESERD